MGKKKGCASTSQTNKLFLALSSRGEGLGQLVDRREDLVKHLVINVHLTHACTAIPVFLISEHLIWRNLLLSVIDIFHLQT